MSHPRLERKRFREKMRRKEFKEAFENLTAVLLRADPDFAVQAEEREEKLVSTTGPDDDQPQDSDGCSFFNRTELINQTVFTLQRFDEENRELQKMYQEVKNGRRSILLHEHNQQILRPEERLGQSKRSGFHQGVGPLASVPQRSETGRMEKAANHVGPSSRTEQQPAQEGKTMGGEGQEEEDGEEQASKSERHAEVLRRRQAAEDDKTPQTTPGVIHSPTPQPPVPPAAPLSSTSVIPCVLPALQLFLLPTASLVSAQSPPLVPSQEFDRRRLQNQHARSLLDASSALRHAGPALRAPLPLGATDSQARTAQQRQQHKNKQDDNDNDNDNNNDSDGKA